MKILQNYAESSRKWSKTINHLLLGFVYCDVDCVKHARMRVFCDAYIPNVLVQENAGQKKNVEWHILRSGFLCTFSSFLYIYCF